MTESKIPGPYGRLQYHDSVRLFRLLPAEHDADPLKGELITTRLSDEPDYRALSYMWGPPDPSTEKLLRVNATNLSLRANLASALIAVRKHRRKGMIRNDYYVWIDLICIQQDCVEEKNHQVQQMGNIYIKAKVVWIWLGEATQLKPKYFTSNDAEASFREVRHDGYDGMPLWHMELRMLFWSLINQHWTRTWILQEVCLARRIAILTDLTIFKESLLEKFRGNKSMLDEASSTKRGWVSSPEYPDPHATTAALIGRVEKILVVRESIRDARWQRISLCSTICQLAAASECFETRDKVFAFLAMSAHGDQIKVNYNIDPCYLFWDVLKLLEIRDIHFQEISSFQSILNLEWRVLLKVTNELILTDPRLRAMRLPCHLDCGILSMKRERNTNPRRSCTAGSHLTNCWFKKDLDEDTREIMVQLRLSPSANGIFTVTDAAYCPDEADVFMYRGLGIQGCEIQVLDTSWNDRREFVAVDPVLWVTLCVLTNLDPKSGTDDLARTFANIEEANDCFYRRRRATKDFGMPLVATSR
ncbi:hypothetical protein LTR70_007158 [Exophiala xenobiotica]|uniref:Heterokaryon incompatibility domain-containing protein n=1 Tax=Lithohypha guttulata TaxID=1690604 RepID=A0ABR0KFD3_9EURO|nr:hypothetical protein LTR24_003245 [Lithohypha guttulata]KAK5314443.1 hypothetical protein LTR70_007158 [Exophiala xenobiotica]